MRLLMLIIFFSVTIFAQKNADSSVDSVKYYLKQSSTNLQNNYFRNALLNAQSAIRRSKIDNDSTATSKSYATLGYVFYKMNYIDDAITSLKSSITYFDVNKKLSEKASIYYLIGMCFSDKNDTKNASLFFAKAEEIYKREKNPVQTALLSLQKGIIYSKNSDSELARKLFLDLILECEKGNHDFDIKAEAYYQIALLEFKSDKNALCLEYLEKALVAQQKIKQNQERKSKILLLLSQCHDKMGNTNLGFDYLKQYNEYQESVYNQGNVDIATTAYNQFKENQRLKQVQELDKELREKEKTSRYTKLIAILAIALISILSLLSIVLYKNNRIRTRSNEILMNKNEELFIAKNRAEKAMQARSDFLSTVSHELRTPLNAINGLTHLLLEEKPKKSQIEYLNSLKFSGNYLLKFINEILEANRIESHKIDVEKINFDLKQLVNDVQNSLKEIALINNNHYEILIDENIPKHLVGDPIKISQVLINLINNSLKFTKNGKVAIDLKLIGTKDNFSEIKFKISDSGIGIPADKIDSIFESFSQGSIEINRTYGGTGLGLTIVKNLIEILGGKIKVESQVGVGSVFWFVLQFENAAEQNLNSTKNIVDLKHLIGKKLLLVEDNKINQLITKKLLEIKKINCDIVGTGEDAVAIVNDNKYDLILMDVHLPGINGTEATKIIREKDATTPIIALTAISLNENREMLLGFGMTDVLTKPFDPDKFYEIIAKYVP